MVERIGGVAHKIREGFVWALLFSMGVDTDWRDRAIKAEWLLAQRTYERDEANTNLHSLRWLLGLDTHVGEEPISDAEAVKNLRALRLQEGVEPNNHEDKRWMYHGEEDEVSCWCGWEAPDEDYEKARASLAAHIRGDREQEPAGG